MGAAIQEVSHCSSEDSDYSHQRPFFFLTPRNGSSFSEHGTKPSVGAWHGLQGTAVWECRDLGLLWASSSEVLQPLSMLLLSKHICDNLNIKHET